MELSKEQIKSIAEDLEIGMRVYVNKETLDIKSLADFDEGYLDEELLEEDIKELEDNREKYIEFEKMGSRDSFRVMEDFADSVEDEELRKQLELVLRLSKPFRNFKAVIDDSGSYRQKWFDFKSARYIEWVKEQLDAYNMRLTE